MYARIRPEGRNRRVVCVTHARGGLAKCIGRKRSLLFPVAVIGLDVVAEEAPHRGAELLVRFVEDFASLESDFLHAFDLARAVASM